MKYQNKISDELVPILKAYTSQPAPPEGMPLQEVFRGALQQMAQQVAVSSTDQLRVENKFFTNSDGLETQLRVFTPLTETNPKPLLYWIHGGGTMSGLPEQEDSTLYNLALELDCVITSVNYRLTPENPYPKPLNDCYEGLLHVVGNADEFGINKDKVVVGGGSAGGLLTTSVAIRARNEGGPKILLQAMAYPMLDIRDTSDSNKEINSVGVWDSWMNHYGFQCYLTNVPESEYGKTVPNMIEDLSNLPDAFIAVGTMDCLRDESIEYAQKLAAAGNQVELHIYPGMVHVFDGLAPDAKASKDFWSARVAAIKRAFE
ncbi:alpha/beta hydrolase [Sinomicrobium pectinilyticum]|nr:alpha/beta hydrolase [Sinomicrobium pectinilyticum]